MKRGRDVWEVSQGYRPFDTVPTDIVTLILSYLVCLEDVFFTKQVCKKFKQAVSRLIQNPSLRFVKGLYHELSATQSYREIVLGQLIMSGSRSLPWPDSPYEIEFLKLVDDKKAVLSECMYATCHCGRKLMSVINVKRYSTHGSVCLNGRCVLKRAIMCVYSMIDGESFTNKKPISTYIPELAGW